MERATNPFPLPVAFRIILVQYGTLFSYYCSYLRLTLAWGGESREELNFLFLSHKYQRGAARREGGDGREMSRSPSRSVFYSFPPALGRQIPDPIPNPILHIYPFASILWHERAKQLDEGDANNGGRRPVRGYPMRPATEICEKQVSPPSTIE